ncbi:MAG: hypothetical protein KAX59_06915, partial [Acidovorax sp.]|nr:hypothetical protein [Acidovorax sp.]
MNATQLVRVDPRDVRVGVPTRVDIFSAEGQLLLGRGSTVYRADNVERLQDSGFKIGASADGAHPRPTESAFQRIGDLADRLTEMEKPLVAGQGLPSFTVKVQALARSVILCCDEDASAALAQSYLDHHHPYSVVHHILVATVVSVLSRVQPWSGADRVSLVAAALSHDIGALSLRQALGQAASLDEAQRAVVREHPELGVRMLGQLGVHEPLWLQAVQDHRATTLMTGPTMYRAMAPLTERYDLSSLHTCCSAGEHLPVPVFDDWQRRTGIRILDHMGST